MVICAIVKLNFHCKQHQCVVSFIRRIELLIHTIFIGDYTIFTSNNIISQMDDTQKMIKYSFNENILTISVRLIDSSFL